MSGMGKIPTFSVNVYKVEYKGAFLALQGWCFSPFIYGHKLHFCAFNAVGIIIHVSGVRIPAPLPGIIPNKNPVNIDRNSILQGLFILGLEAILIPSFT
jgi:hypothetical protein